jgi:hypothetical protein
VKLTSKGMERACAPSLAAALGLYGGTNRRFAPGAGSQKAAAPLPASGVAPHASQWDTCVGAMARRCRQKRPRLLASVQPWSLAPGSTPPVRQRVSGKPAAIRRALRARVPSAEARPVSAPSLSRVQRTGLPAPNARGRGHGASFKARARGVERDVLRLWSRLAIATGGGAHDSAASGATMAHSPIQAVNQRRHFLRSRTDVKVTESFRASRDCPGRAYHSPLGDETGPPPPQRAAVSKLNELMSRAGHASNRS